MTEFEKSRATQEIYEVRDERRDGVGDIYSDFFATEDEARAAASRQWNHLTASEQAARTIGIYKLTQDGIGDMIDDDAEWWYSVADRDHAIKSY